MGFLYSQFCVTPAYPTQSFQGQTIIVTGSNTGLGKEAARHFARLGAARLILAVRNTQAGDAAKADIENTTGTTTAIEVWKLDLGSFASVQAFADRAAKELDRVDVLCENAGISTRTKTMVEGHESTIAVNVVGTFFLALLMLPKLRETARAHGKDTILTIVSSEVHGWCTMKEHKESAVLAALDRSEDLSERYQASKLLEVLVVRHIAPKLQGSGVVLNMLNPGLCHSELGKESGFAFTVFKFVVARTTEIGSRCLVAAAAAGPESHGKYMTDGLVDDGALSAFARSEDAKVAGEKVWDELAEILEKVQPGVTKNL